MDLTPFFRLLHAVAALWHVLAFAAGMVFVYFSYRTLFNLGAYDRIWGKIIRHADIHLWLSGFAMIAVGTALTGIQAYFANPKLWTKILVIMVWLITTQIMRRIAVPALKKGNRQLMLATSGISLGTWIYGAFLGGAKTLANGNASFAFLVGGFLLTLVACLTATYATENWMKKKNAGA